MLKAQSAKAEALFAPKAFFFFSSSFKKKQLLQVGEREFESLVFLIKETKQCHWVTRIK